MQKKREKKNFYTYSVPFYLYFRKRRGESGHRVLHFWTVFPDSYRTKMETEGIEGEIKADLELFLCKESLRYEVESRFVKGECS